MEVKNKNTTPKTIPNDVDKEQKGINVPNLRFKEEKWISVKNYQLFSIASEKNKNNLVVNVLSASQEKGMIPRNEIGIDISFDKNSISNYKIVNIGDYVVHLRSFQGGFAFSKQEGICSPAYTILRPNLKYLSSSFFESYFTSQKFINSLKLVTYGIRDGRSIAVDEWLNMSTYIPSREIQDKIINFIENLNLRINTQSKIIEDLETLKNSIWNHIYTRESINWDQIKLKNILTERKTYCIKDSKYPHATLSKEGVGLKTDRYNRDFLVKDDEKNYKVTHLNDICYNPANLKFGVICRNKLGSAIFSPIYITYEVNHKVNAAFIEYILTSNSFINYIRKYEQGTVYERMAVNSDDFLKGIIKIPSLEEQSKIVNLMNSFEQKIKKEKDMLELYKKQKAYLLQNMFI